MMGTELSVSRIYFERVRVVPPASCSRHSAQLRIVLQIYERFQRFQRVPPDPGERHFTGQMFTCLCLDWILILSLLERHFKLYFHSLRACGVTRLGILMKQFF